MRVEFVWPYEVGQTAAALLDSVLEITKLPFQADYSSGVFGTREEVLSVEVPGLSDCDADGRGYGVKLSEAASALYRAGIQPRVIIDGNCLWFYAADREYRAKELKAVCIEAAKMLKATRGWFKDARLAGIRRFLEPGSHP